MAQARYYSSTAKKTTLVNPINSTDTSITVALASGYPTGYPFTIVIDKDTIDEELVECTNVSGTILTITRGVDSTTAVSHSVGAQVEHAFSGRDFRESRQHEDATSNVHGLALGSNVVGESETQTLTNKTLTSAALGGDLDAGSNKITNLADPTSAQDAVSKTWAETAVTSQVAQATTQATNSASSATASASSAAASAASAAAALVSEGNAATSSASASAASASASADAVLTAADVVSTNADVVSAAASAAAALASQGAASTSESNAVSSASSAAASQVAAASAAAAAAASYDQFDDRYLGQKSSAPSTDNDGDVLVTGALYYDQVQQKMYVYDGSGWLPASAASVASIVTYEYTATASQTVFTGNDDNAVSLSFKGALIQVFLNGVLLSPGDDYTTSTNTVTLASGAALNDVLVVVAFASFNVANTYTQAQADALFATKTELTSVEALALLGL